MHNTIFIQENDEKRLVDYFDFLSNFTKNEHRGIRIVALEGISLYSSSQLSGSKSSDFKPFLRERLDSFVKDLISTIIQEGHREVRLIVLNIRGPISYVYQLNYVHLFLIKM